MDSVFGVGPAEFILILLLASLLMGPHQIRRVARQLGYWSIRFRRIYRAFVAQINAELDAVDETGEIRSGFNEVRSIGQQVGDLRRDIVNDVRTMQQEGRDIARSTQEAVEETLQPPVPEEEVQDDESEQEGKSEDGLPPIPPPPKPLDVEGDPSS